MKHLSPHVAALLALMVGAGLSIAGVYQLAGMGWALIAGAVPPLLLAVIIMRGLFRAQQNPQ